MNPEVVNIEGAASTVVLAGHSGQSSKFEIGMIRHTDMHG